jgi:bifunctional NMN adenylyltransferase/nudix hydrolase
MKTNVIIGRFQTPELHRGHTYLIEKAYQELPAGTHPFGKDGKVIIVVGCSVVNYRDRNPLSFEIIKGMIEKHYKGYMKHVIEVLPLHDHPSNAQWSENLDTLLKDYPDVTLYGSRDCFHQFYSGKLPFKEIDEVTNVSASKLRQQLARLNKHRNTENFRRGVIHAAVNQFPTAFPTVDVAVISEDGKSILLGRKPGRTNWCLIGGFVDPTDESLEDAAARELGEEVAGITVGPMNYVCSKKIHDFRYKNSRDGIISSLFTCQYYGGTPVASDDIEECKWVTFKDLEANPEILTVHHQPLLAELREFLENFVI